MHMTETLGDLRSDRKVWSHQQSCEFPQLITRPPGIIICVGHPLPEIHVLNTNVSRSERKTISSKDVSFSSTCVMGEIVCDADILKHMYSYSFLIHQNARVRCK